MQLLSMAITKYCSFHLRQCHRNFVISHVIVRICLWRLHDDRAVVAASVDVAVAVGSSGRRTRRSLLLTTSFLILPV